MSELMIKPVFLPNKGVALDAPEEFLPERISPYSRNMEFFNEFIQGRGGLDKFDTTVLSGAITAVPRLIRRATAERFTLFCTKKDIYAYDFGNSRFDILTPTYTTGTIEVKTGELTKVYGSGTPNWSANLKAGDYIKIGSGNIHTGATWYEIASVDSNTLLTLTSAAPITAAGANYVARKIFTGVDSNRWSWEQFVDDNLAEVVIMTNGVDLPVYWPGSGQVVPLSGLATGFTAAKFVSVFSGRVHFSATVEGGSNTYQRDRWSDPNNCLSWQDEDFIDFLDEPTDITGAVNWGGYHVIFKEEEAYLGRYVGGTQIFDYSDKSPNCWGTPSGFSLVRGKSFLGYYGSDKKFHLWNISTDKIISEPFFGDTKYFDPTLEQQICGLNIKRKNQIRWFCPRTSTTKFDYVFVYDYSANIGQVWEYAEDDACCSLGAYRETTDLYADDDTFGAQYADETTGYADESFFVNNAEVIIYGGWDGVVRICDSGADDDGSTFERILRIKRLNFGMADKIKRLKKQQWWLNAEGSGSVSIKTRKDDDTEYSGDTKTISLVADISTQSVVKRSITLDLWGQNFQPEIVASNHFALIGFINYVHPKGMTN